MHQNRKKRSLHLYNPVVKPLSKVFSHRDYFKYYRNLLVENNNMKNSTFHRMIESESEPLPQLFRITAESPYKEKLIEELRDFLPLLKKCKVKASILNCLEDKFGTIARVFFTPGLTKKRPSLEMYSDWINVNSQGGFLSRFELSSLLPFIFLDINPSDSVLSLSYNNPQVCEIISGILPDGFLFINEPDIKRARTQLNLGLSNCCVLSYHLFDFPDIIEFDKVLCIAPSTEDGAIRNKPGINSLWSIDKAVENHKNQRQLLISSLEKVKPGGLCVYATYAINPFENEAVINCVLQMEKFKGKFELVDCSSMYKDLKRKKGLNQWTMTDVHPIKEDPELMLSLTSDFKIDNLDRCMRFYPHQSNSNGTFIAVIKKLDNIEKVYTPSLSTGNEEQPSLTKWASNLSDAPDDVIEKFMSDFGLPEGIKQIPFIYSQSDKQVNILYNVTPSLKAVLTNQMLKTLRIVEVGSRAFSFSAKYPEEPAIPSVQSLPDVAQTPTNRFITISLNDFKEMIVNCQLNFRQLPQETQMYLEGLPSGGIYILLDGYGPLLGALWKDPFVRLIIKKGAAARLFKMAEVFLMKDEEIQDEEQILEKENQGEEEEEEAHEEFNEIDTVERSTKKKKEVHHNFTLEEIKEEEKETKKIEPAEQVEEEQKPNPETEEQEETPKRRRRRKSHHEEE